MKSAMATILLVLLSLFIHSNAKEKAFDVRQHLSIVSRYSVVEDIADSSFVPSKIPDGCTPIHLNLVARHENRSPTKKRIKELDNLAAHLEVLLREAEEQNLSLEKLPGWLKGGELIIQGEDELYDIGIRTRARFPNLFNDDYHPDVYAIKATQVPGASASAVAFGMGLFSGKGSLGPGRHRAFVVPNESRASDTMLRFHDYCQNYKAFKKSQEPAVDKLKEPVYDEITSALRRRHRLNLTRKDKTSLWFLCKQEASLLNIVDQACALFSPSEVSLLQWTDDLEAFILKGYGKSINYKMGVPLLEDVVQSMEQAIKAEEDNPIARLRFAHAETVVPFSCLLGLFLDGSKFQKIQREQSLQLPPKHPQKRNWRGNTVTPFGGNNILVLYCCLANTSNKHFVQVLHNEHPIPMPERIVAPHLKHDYNSVCNVKLEQQEQKPVASKLSQLFRWMFSLGNGDKRSLDEL
ncbi:hypothetical protein PRUPE_6G130900 [Prunus persica]|uniref:Multiple inositol polyphosphate phosphatase 1 n=1 Tax=Prunus persica TaxID=3760 RepID=A0A251NPN5_PRUPE|nr:hypothetical protein PRUPE_6G130900 [Prunus persica]